MSHPPPPPSPNRQTVHRGGGGGIRPLCAPWACEPFRQETVAHLQISQREGTIDPLC